LKDAVELLDDFVALTGRHFESLAVQNIDGGAAVLDRFVFLQHSRGKGHSRAVGPEHGGQKIVRNGETASAHAVLGHEQPAGKALLNFVEAIARGGLRDLLPLEHGIAIQAHLEFRSGLESSGCVVLTKHPRIWNPARRLLGRHLRDLV
jgi:hypothetical protein